MDLLCDPVAGRWQLDEQGQPCQDVLFSVYDILQRLLSAGLTRITGPRLSQHLKVLESAGWIRRVRDPLMRDVVLVTIPDTQFPFTMAMIRGMHPLYRQEHLRQAPAQDVLFNDGWGVSDPGPTPHAEGIQQDDAMSDHPPV